jgi:hypothetical protein
MDSNKKKARIAGLLYLVVVIAGIFSLAYVPTQLIVWDDAAKTVQNIKASDYLFRWEILAGVICYTAFVFLPLALYRLFKDVNITHARLMVILALLSIPINFLNMTNKFAVLNLINDPTYVKTFGVEQLHSQVMFYLHSYNSGNHMASVFWSLWLFPFGYLVFKSGMIPKIFGVFLMIATVTYLIEFVGNTLVVNFYDTVISDYISIPASIAEIGICLWLVIVGARNKPVSRPVESPAMPLAS